MDSIASLTTVIDLHDLATRLGLHREPSGLYRAAWRDDSKGSVSVFAAGKRWKDHGDAEKRGSAIDLFRAVRGGTVSDAIRELSALYAIERPHQAAPQASQDGTDAGYLWRICAGHKDLERAFAYLKDVRGIVSAAEYAGKLYGYTDYKPTDPQYGPGVVFPLKTPNSGAITAINIRYIDSGDKRIVGSAAKSVGVFRATPSKITIKESIYLCESPIDALTICDAGADAVAFVSAAWASKIDLSWIPKTRRVVICPDDDDAGKQAATILYHRLIDAGLTPAVLEPCGHKDLNELLVKEDRRAVIDALRSISTALLPVDCPFLSATEYARFVATLAHLDHCDAVSHGRDGDEQTKIASGFRPYRIDTIRMRAPGFALFERPLDSTQKHAIRYRAVGGDRLETAIIDAGSLGKLSAASEIGLVHSPAATAMIYQLLMRDKHRQIIDAVPAAGLVHSPTGLKAQDGKAAMLESDQCVYSSLEFPATPAKPAGILADFAGLTRRHLSLYAFCWSVGAAAKAIIGYWPHLIVSAPSQSGKTSILERLSHSTATQIYDHSELITPYRRMRLLANHLLPIWIDEASRAGDEAISGFIDVLNASYRGAIRNHSNRPNLLAGAAALVGQDAPITDAAVLSKCIMIELTGSDKGALTDPGQWPWVAWSDWLIARWTRDSALAAIQHHAAQLQGHESGTDSESDRHGANYGALAWIVSECWQFAGLSNPPVSGINEISTAHLQITQPSRRESTAILDRLAREIAIDNRSWIPRRFEVVDGRNALIVPPAAILDYLRSKGALFAVRTSRRLIEHLARDGYLIKRGVQASLQGVKYSSCVALDLDAMGRAGIDFPQQSTI